MTRNEAAERLRQHLVGFGNTQTPTPWESTLDTALAEERRHAIEQIRERLTAYNYWAKRDVNDYEADTDEMQTEMVAILDDLSVDSSTRTPEQKR